MLWELRNWMLWELRNWELRPNTLEAHIYCDPMNALGTMILQRNTLLTATLLTDTLVPNTLADCDLVYCEIVNQYTIV